MPSSRQGGGVCSRLLRLRREQPQFRYGDHAFHNDYEHYQSRGVLLFSRSYGWRYSLVALNFGDFEQAVPFVFPLSGNYREELHGFENVSGIVAGQEVQLTVPSNYGRVWTLG